MSLLWRKIAGSRKHPPKLLDKNCDSEMQKERIGIRPHQASLEAVAIYLHLAG
jgi:hypothetical protein